MTEFDKELQAILDIAREIILKDGELAPVLFVNTELKGKMLFALAEFTPENKHKMLYQIGKMTSKFGVKSVVHLAEAWMVRPVNGERLTVPPSQHPDRQECLILVWSDKPKSYESKALLMVVPMVELKTYRPALITHNTSS